jgi:hypothetical protein
MIVSLTIGGGRPGGRSAIVSESIVNGSIVNESIVNESILFVSLALA